jgi:alpha-tubulin suppressor-like RCC1 family protein
MVFKVNTDQLLLRDSIGPELPILDDITVGGTLWHYTNRDSNGETFWQQTANSASWKYIAGDPGSNFSFAIRTDGTLWGWGYNPQWYTGAIAGTWVSSPTQIGSNTNWKAISALSYAATAIKTDGTIWSWGLNNSGQLGLNDTINRSSPTQIGNSNDWFAIDYTLALKNNGTLWSWGQNGNGEVGDITTITKSSPVQIGANTNWKSISNASSIKMAIKSDGTLWIWGEGSRLNPNELFPLGKTYSSPVQIGANTNWRSVHAGGSVTAFKTDGTLWAWGSNVVGQIGDNTSINRSSPVQVFSQGDGQIPWRYVEIGGNNFFSGNTHTIGVKSDGTLWVWGTWNYNPSNTADGQWIPYRSSPVQLLTHVFSRAIPETSNVGFKKVSMISPATGITGSVNFLALKDPGYN